MIVKKHLAVVLALAMLIGSFSAPAAEKGPKKLVFMGYPDGAEWLITDVLRRLGDAYQEANPDARLLLRPRVTYKEARETVLRGEAVGMMISERLNRFRAYKSQSGSKTRGYSTMELNIFVPVATRIMRSETEILARMRLGFVTDRISPELKDFMDFLGTDAAREALKDMQDIEIAVPAAKPTPVERGLERGPKEVTLEQPILTY